MRKRRAVKRDVLPDPIYKSKIVAKLINTVMLDGKKGIAQSIVYEAFDTVKEKTGKDALETFNEAKKKGLTKAQILKNIERWTAEANRDSSGKLIEVDNKVKLKIKK